MNTIKASGYPMCFVMMKNWKGDGWSDERTESFQEWETLWPALCFQNTACYETIWSQLSRQVLWVSWTCRLMMFVILSLQIGIWLWWCRQNASCFAIQLEMFDDVFTLISCYTVCLFFARCPQCSTHAVMLQWNQGHCWKTLYKALHRDHQTVDVINNRFRIHKKVMHYRKGKRDVISGQFLNRSETDGGLPFSDEHFQILRCTRWYTLNLKPINLLYSALLHVLYCLLQFLTHQQAMQGISIICMS